MWLIYVDFRNFCPYPLAFKKSHTKFQFPTSLLFIWVVFFMEFLSFPGNYEKSSLMAENFSPFPRFWPSAWISKNSSRRLWSSKTRNIISQVPSCSGKGRPLRWSLFPFSTPSGTNFKKSRFSGRLSQTRDQYAKF